jgi:leucyl-tRNA synthetase
MSNRIYSPQAIEKKYTKLWNKADYLASKKPTKNKYYCLDMFPYPSANGVHVGHWRGYILSDIYTRKKWLEGHEILHPMGWDAFGLPAENYAIKNKVHPSKIIGESITNFRSQIKKMGALYNWEKEIATTDPDYYKWTQWIFLQMFKSGLAYEEERPVNWCPQCKTGLANEEVTKNQCERCKNTIIQKNIRQWILKITHYSEDLLSGLDKLDWPEKIKTMQRNWIGKSFGLNITLTLADTPGESITVYTTCPETIYGVTFIGLSYEHPLLQKLLSQEELENITKNFAVGDCKESNQDDMYDGFFINRYVIHPLTSLRIPIYIVRYVIKEYGTGSIMGVPSHDSRDFQFAIKHSLPLRPVIMDPCGDNNTAYEGDGILFNSEHFDGVTAKTEGRKNITEFLIQKGVAIKKINYKMRDWVFSRQRYWGEPIPLIHCPSCGIVAVPEEELPIKLPHIKHYEPTETGASPLENISSWVNVDCYQCGKKAKRETNTMPQWAGSCWYFIRFVDPQCKDAIASPEAVKKWLPVDLYVGGIEHAILHLLYARFYVKFLFEKGIIPFDEPFLKLFNQGMINKRSEKSGAIEKMSKSKGNVVNPDDIIEKYGTDALRLYIIFIAPPEIDSEWREDGVLGCYRFLKRFWTVMTDKNHETEEVSKEAEQEVARFLKHYDEKITTFHTNTAVSEMMKFVNTITGKNIKLTIAMKEKVLAACSVLTPYICEEILHRLDSSIAKSSWPSYDEALLQTSTVSIAIQINGKFRSVITTAAQASRQDIEKEAHAKVKKWLQEVSEKEIKIIYVQGKLINFVFKQK